MKTCNMCLTEQPLSDLNYLQGQTWQDPALPSPSKE